MRHIGSRIKPAAHFSRVVELDPNNAAAWKRLGYKRVGGRWRTGEEIEQAQARQKQVRSDLAQWRPKVLKLRQALLASDGERCESARRQLSAIDDPAAIPALEIVLASSGETAATTAVDAIRKIPGQAASLSLARLAAFSPWIDSRQRATTQLKLRPLVEFVPGMLAAMIAPVESRGELYYDNSRSTRHDALRQSGTTPATADADRLLHRQVFSRETPSGRVERAFDTPFSLRGDPAMVQMISEMMVRSNGLKSWEQSQLQAENSRSMEFNRPIAEVLSAVSGQQLGTLPKAWSDWWDRYNDTYREPTPVQQTVAPQYTPPMMVSVPPTPLQGMSRGRFGECFAAGTTVWTLEGPKAVERVSVGDLVLSQNVETGQLAYKPVLRAAVRPPLALVAVTVGKDVLRCTGGHPFWTPGRGWVHARRLDPPAFLHALTGTVEAAAVKPGPTEKTYNLEVADFHSYFVGQGKILVHDVTPLTPTTTDVPGLKTR